MTIQKTELAEQRHHALKSPDERVIRPAVDIFEDETGITLHADMPGVAKKRLDVQVDSDTLTISGESRLAMPKDLDALYADMNVTHYRRSFSLSRELDSEKIEANLHDGLLTLRILKREEHKPRKIKVQAA